ncbi:hypothetical protein HPB47_004816 [Ixodes persulcatus]|uniref:Uncharacterized protein n=1 Tax=Ixodes persulcatus TaxID=34615 RepID=A0AC60PEU1_IXOPE|nr:hypothetical protein HPB47_004816 [Ixodes persulcatus]
MERIVEETGVADVRRLVQMERNYQRKVPHGHPERAAAERLCRLGWVEDPPTMTSRAGLVFWVTLAQAKAALEVEEEDESG